jgi:hypothetical protein
MPTETFLSHDVLNAALVGLEAQKQTIEQHISQVRGMLGVPGPKRRGRPPKSAASAVAPTAGPKKRKFSAATRAKMAASQKKRWAAIKGEGEAPAATPKRKISAAARKRMAEGAKKRWAEKKSAASLGS